MRPFEFIVKWRWPTCEVTIGPDGPIGPLPTGVAWDPDGHGGTRPGSQESRSASCANRTPAARQNDARTGSHP